MKKTFGPMGVLCAAMLATTPATAAIAKLQDLGSATASTAMSMTLTLSVAGGVPVGHTVLVTFATNGNPTCTVSDIRGNTYTQDLNVTNFGAVSAYAFHATVTTALLNTDTITVTFGGGTFTGAMTATEFSGLSSTPLDQVGAKIGNSSSWDSGFSGTTTQTNELLLGVVAATGTVATIGPGSSGYIPLPSATVTASGTTVNVYAEYFITSGMASYVASGTVSPSMTWAAQITTYKENLLPVELQRIAAD